MLHKVIRKVGEVGSCNFCKRGIVNEDGDISYPYDKVNVLTSECSLIVRICNRCLKELKKI